jgi:hypothetical protein
MPLVMYLKTYLKSLKYHLMYLEDYKYHLITNIFYYYAECSEIIKLNLSSHIRQTTEVFTFHICNALSKPNLAFNSWGRYLKFLAQGL